MCFFSISDYTVNPDQNIKLKYIIYTGHADTYIFIYLSRGDGI